MTPMMQQYREAKARHPGMVLLFRMGDFFETFEEDAELVSRVLGLTLTTRDGTIPMAGVPGRRGPTPAGPGRGEGGPAAGRHRPAGLDVRPGNRPGGPQRPLQGDHAERVRVPGRPAVRGRRRGARHLPAGDAQVEPGPRP